MQTLARNGYTAEQVRAALHAPQRKVAFRYELLNSKNVKTKNLTSVLSARVANNALAQIKRTAVFSVHDNSDINYLEDRIKPWVRLWIPPGRILARYYAYLLPTQPYLYKTLQEAPESGGWVEWPLGVFLLSTPPRKEITAGVITREIEGYDLLQILVDDKVEDRYVVKAGTNYITSVGNLLTSAGMVSQNLTPTSKALPADRDWPPGTAKKLIVNDLLGAVNYKSITIDEHGVAVAEPYVSPADRASEYTYRDDDQSVIFPGVEDHLDLFAIPNKWVLTVSEPDREPLISVYTNDNPDSITSTINRARTIVDSRTVDAADQASLDAQVKRLAFEASQVYEQVSFETAIMPMHSDADVLTLACTNLGLSAKFSEVSWEMNLKAGARMRHWVRRVVNI